MCAGTRYKALEKRHVILMSLKHTAHSIQHTSHPIPQAQHKRQPIDQPNTIRSAHTPRSETDHEAAIGGLFCPFLFHSRL